MKRLIIFDLDGTLAESKSPLAPEMAALLGSLLEVAKVAIISGGAWPQFQTQILPRLTAECRLQDLYLLPTCGTKFYRHDTTWTPLYADEFTTEQKDVIIAALKLAMDESGFAPARYWGEVIEDRGGQITMSALGQEAPLEEKKIWDPDFAKRRLIQRRLAELIPDFSVRLGGATSIDVTKMGVDKAFGIGKLRELLGIETSEMIFVGDALFPGGNDFAATTTGAACVEVSDPSDTKRVINAIIACLKP